MKKKILKALAVVACAILLVVGSVAGTLAYLTAKTETVTNTFTVGDIKITLDETPVDGNGKATTGDKVKANAYHLIPGGEYDKDPTVHVEANSEKCYLYVKVVNYLAAVETATGSGKTIAEQIAANGWKPLTGVENVYYQVVDKPATDKDVPVFSKVYIGTNVTNSALENLTGNTVAITAYAIQFAGFDDAAKTEVENANAAWTEGGFGN